jgi:tetratricopeptide (TPR) repeat protein
MPSRSSSAASARTIGDRVEAARALHADGRSREALDLLSGPGDFSQDAYTLRGDLQLQLGQLHEALGSYSTVIAFERHNMYAHQRLALCLYRLERWEAAAETFRKLLSHDTYSDHAHIGLGDCLLRLNRPEEALSSFEACWSESARLRALFGKAVALQLLRRFDEAEVLYDRILELEPRSEEALGNLIAMSMEVFDLSRVHRYALRLAAISPESTVALQALTLVAFERRDYETAAGFLSDLMERAPEGKFADSGESGDEIWYRLSESDVERLSAFRRSSPHALSKRVNAGIRED